MPTTDNTVSNANSLNSQISDKPNPKLGKAKSGVLDKKKKVFGKIAAAKAMVEGVKKKTTSSMDSINNDGNSLSFLTDLIKSLIGYAALLDVVINFLTNNIPEIEELIKSSLKDELHSLVSCGINPTIPTFLYNPGIIIEVSKIDFLDQLKTDPSSFFGALMYNDVTPQLTNSKDFNTFLYGVIQDDGNQNTWDGMLDITFNSVGNLTRPNNALTIKVNPSFNITKLTDLNNSFISKGTLFDTNKIVNKTIDSIYGSISNATQKTLKQLETEAKINDIIDKMIEANANENIDDSYFTFTNDEVAKQQESATWRKKGLAKLQTSTNIVVSMPPQLLIDFNTEMSGATTLNKKEIVKTNINRMAEQNASTSPDPKDHTAIKLDFIENIIKTLIKSFASAIISPKILFIFLINFKIVYGQGKDYADAIDFMKLSKNLFKLIIKKITKRFIKELIKVSLVYIAKLTSDMAAKRQVEKASDKKSQILSLVGVPQDAIRMIKGLM